MDHRQPPRAVPSPDRCRPPVARFAGVAMLATLGLVGTVVAQSGATKPEKPPKVKVGVETCVPTVLAKVPGEVLQVVLKSEKGRASWEIEIEGTDGKLHDIECSGVDGRITETETRVASADAAGFKEKVKVTEAQAQATALAKYPGTVERVEYEIESDGRAVYEFDIKPASGHDWRVEVDATSGEITEASPEWLEIGRL